MVSAIPRAEHPRPDFQRDTFLNLNGTWQFAFDDADEGLRGRWQQPGHALGGEIVVPFCYQCRASGIGTDAIHPILWYRRSFSVPQEMANRRVLLRFGAVDYACRVFVNGQEVGAHEGGYTPFALDITHALCEGENDLCLRVVDEPDCAQPRGKQYWKEGVMGCWYTPVSGIWQTVYLEATGEESLRSVHITPDIDTGIATVDLSLERIPRIPLTARIAITCQGDSWETQVRVDGKQRIRVPVSLLAGGRYTLHRWSPENPVLHDVEITLESEGVTMDRVRTYFGMRTVELRDGKVLLNHSRLYQRLVLDQGYWPDTLLTPPSDDAIREDVALTLKLGYNGARKHQKIEDPRYYYWADRLGLLVWGELPSPYEFCGDMVSRLSSTLTAFIDRDYNHPCIICWTPLNESWGVDNILNDRLQQETARLLYHQAKALDGTRLVSGNDGWEQVETDVCALHDYAAQGDVLAAHLADREQVERHGCDDRMCWAGNASRRGDEAFLLTEYGGIALADADPKVGGMQTWGYHDKVQGEEQFFARFEGVTDAILALPYCEGFCYTQLTDVMQETNGILTAERKPKVDIARFAKLNTKPKK